MSLEERRRWWRTASAPVSVTLRTLQPPWREESTVSLDLSEGGLRFTTLMPLAAGSLIELEMVLPFDSLPLCVESAIAWVRERNVKGVPNFEVGVRFVEMSAPDRGRLHQYLTRAAGAR